MTDLDIMQTGLLELDSGFMAQVGGGAADWITTKTKDEWEKDGKAVSEKNHMYVVSDYQTDDDGTVHPGIKIGDGKAYIIDLPYISGHRVSGSISSEDITSEDIKAWNNKVSTSLSGDTLIFTTSNNTGE